MMSVECLELKLFYSRFKTFLYWILLYTRKKYENHIEKQYKAQVLKLKANIQLRQIRMIHRLY